MSSGTVSGLLFLLFSSQTSKAGLGNWAEVTWGQMAGTEIADGKNSIWKFCEDTWNFHPIPDSSPMRSRWASQKAESVLLGQ